MYCFHNIHENQVLDIPRWPCFIRGRLNFNFSFGILITVQVWNYLVENKKMKLKKLESVFLFFWGVTTEVTFSLEASTERGFTDLFLDWGIKARVVNCFWKKSLNFFFVSFFNCFSKTIVLFSEQMIVFKNDPLVLSFKKTNKNRFWKRLFL